MGRLLLMWTGLVLGLVAVPHAALARTFYVDRVKGNDANTASQAQSASTPWKTIKRALSTAVGGDTVLVKPGTYMESVESKRDGTATALLTLRSFTAGAAIIQPPSGTNGFFISHSYHVIDGFGVTNAVNGIKAGPHDTTNGPVVGLLVQNNVVYGNSNNGIQFNNGLSGEIAFNTVYQNGQNGIEYEGNASLIHDNVVHDNAQFGIYVRDGVDHQLANNQAYNNASGDIKMLGTLLQTDRTYYVDGTNGNDAYTQDQAQSAASPWKTIKNAAVVAQPGTTIIVQPGTYTESVESKRDGTSARPIVFQAAQPGQVIIDPPSGTTAFVITHDYYQIDGFTITGGLNGIQLGPHEGGDGPVNGLVATNNVIYGNSAVGLKFTSAVSGVATHNVIYNNGRDGILYQNSSVSSGASNANIFNNLIYSNGLAGGGVYYGIQLAAGSGHQITNNTIVGNVSGGVLLGTSDTAPVFATLRNNIIVGNPNGIKERSSSGYTGKGDLDYNDVFGNTTKNYDLNLATGTVAGPNSISADPIFLNSASGDFRLGRVATGQAADSPCIDRGSATSAALGLANRTAFPDKYADSGQVDLGYHGTIIYPSQGTLTISQAGAALNPGNNDSLNVTGNLSAGTGSDGIDPGVNYTEIDFGNLVFILPLSGFQQQGAQWTFTSAGPVTSAVFQKQADGSVNFTVQASGLSISYNDSPVPVTVRVGDDFGSTTIGFRGILQYP